MINNTVILGTDHGQIQIWDMEKVLMLHQFSAHKGNDRRLYIGIMKKESEPRTLLSDTFGRMTSRLLPDT